MAELKLHTWRPLRAEADISIRTIEEGDALIDHACFTPIRLLKAISAIGLTSRLEGASRTNH
jgi:hypothetical protein